MASYVKFGRGTKSAAEVAQINAGMVYFNTTSQEIYLDGKVYGLSTGDLEKLNGAIKGISYSEADRKLTVTYVNGTTADLFTFPIASNEDGASVPGLMAPAHVTELGQATSNIATLMGAASVDGSVAKALADAKAYTDESIQALDVEEAGKEGQAIVNLKQEDGKIVAVAGDVAAAHVSVVDENNYFTGADVESVLAEVGADIADTESRLQAIEEDLDNGGDIDARINAAVEALDVAEMSETGKYVKTVSEVDGKVSVTFGQVAASEVSVADGAGLFDGSTVEAVLAEIDADHKAGDQAIMDVIGSVTEGKTVVKMIEEAQAAAELAASNLVEGLDANVSSSADEKVVVSVVQENGVVTGVSIEDKDIASAATLKAVKDQVDAFFADDAKVEGTIDTLVEIQTWVNEHKGDAADMIKDIEANTEAISDEAARAAAAEDKIEAFVGLAEDGSYSAPTDSNFINASTSVMDAVKKLDSAIATQAAAATSVVAEGTDAGNNMSIAKTTGENGEKVFTINLTDVASAAGMAEAIEDINEAIEANAKLSEDYVGADYASAGTESDFGECTFSPAVKGDSLEAAIGKVDSNVAELLGGVLRNELTVAASLNDLNEKDAENLQAAKGHADQVAATAKSEAIAAVVGADTDAATADTVYGAKAHATAAAATAKSEATAAANAYTDGLFEWYEDAAE